VGQTKKHFKGNFVAMRVILVDMLQVATIAHRLRSCWKRSLFTGSTPR
jgi:hypothetical protein